MPPVTAESPELELLGATTREFLDRDMPLSRVRELHASGQSYDRGWWRRAAELGWTSLLIPESLGGGPAAVVGDDPTTMAVGQKYLSRQAVCLGGGTTEIARNIIAERVLVFPREYAADRGVPFNDVPRNGGRR